MKNAELLRADLTLAPDAAEREVIKHARRLTSLQARRRRLMKALRELEDEIRTAKRMLRAVVADVAGRDAPIELIPAEGSAPPAPTPIETIEDAIFDEASERDGRPTTTAPATDDPRRI